MLHDFVGSRWFYNIYDVQQLPLDQSLRSPRITLLMLSGKSAWTGRKQANHLHLKMLSHSRVQLTATHSSRLGIVWNSMNRPLTSAFPRAEVWHLHSVFQLYALMHAAAVVLSRYPPLTYLRSYVFSPKK